MSDDDGSLFGLGRGSLTAIGAVLVVIGIILILVAATALTAPSSNPFDFAASQARMSSAFGTAVVGMILFGVGGEALGLGLLSPLTSDLSVEASTPIERGSEAACVGRRQGSGC